MTDASPQSSSPPVATLSSRRPLRLALMGFVGIVLLYAAAWAASAAILRGKVEQWIAARTADGFVIQSKPATLAGFPTRVAVRLEDLHVTVPPVNGGWSWQTPSVEVIGSVFRPTHIGLDLSGSHRVAGPWLPGALQIQNKRASLVLALDSAGKVDTADIHIVQADMGLDGGGALLHVDQAGATFTVVPAPTTSAGPATSSRLVLAVDELKFPDVIPAPMARTLHKLELTAEVVGPVPAGPLPQLLEAWRTAGGAINLKDFALDWPPLFLAGDGTIALDEHLQPMGAFTAHVRGFAAAIDVLTEQGKMRKNEAGVAKGILGMMAKPAADNSGPEITLPITVQDRVLSAGPMTLLQIPIVNWPNGPPP